jgi:hypothetical protein
MYSGPEDRRKGIKLQIEQTDTVLVNNCCKEYNIILESYLEKRRACIWGWNWNTGGQASS